MKHGFFVALLCVIFSGASQAAEPRSLEEIVQNVPKVQLPEMMDALRAERKSSAQVSPQFVRVFRWACTRLETPDLPAMAEIYASVTGDSYYEEQQLFTALAKAWLRLKIPAVLAKKPAFPSTVTAMPEPPAGYPPELREAAERCWQVMGPFQALKPPAAGVDFQTHRTEYWKLAAQLLAEKNGPFTEKFLAYRWGGFCGTGSDRFLSPQSIAVVLALAADGRWAEAAGASLEAAPDDNDDGTLRVLNACVDDPETVVVGALALDEFRPHARQTAVRLGQLLRLPGDGRVEKLILLAAHARPENLALYFRALGKFVPTGSTPQGQKYFSGWGWGTGGDNLDTISAKPVSAAAQKQALDFLCAQATATLPIEAAKTLAKIFHASRNAESIPALRRLVDHPSASVAKEAGEALEFLGEKVVMPEKLGSVRYQLLVDGHPYAAWKVDWAIKGNGSSIGSSVATDDAGVASVPRDYFLGTGKVEQVALRSTEMSGPASPWFGVLLPPPPATDDVIPVAVTTKSLRVKLPLPRPENEWKDQKMEIVLWGLQDAVQQGIGFWSPAKFELPVSREVNFSKLMPGTYRLEIRLAGATSWTGELRVGESPEFTVPLERASDVRFTAKVPAGWHNNLVIPELRKDGKAFPSDRDYESGRLRGVPVGNYVLHLSSSAEIRKRVMGLLPDGPEFDGVDVPFAVTADSPVEIDLGEVEMKVRS